MFVPVQCRACDRLRPTKPGVTLPPGNDNGVERCDAFPDGIPASISRYGADHRLPVGRERDGLVFRLAEGPEAEEAYAEWLRTFGGPDPLPSIPSEGSTS